MVSTVISCACPGARETFRFWKRKHIAANQLVSRAGDVHILPLSLAVPAANCYGGIEDGFSNEEAEVHHH